MPGRQLTKTRPRARFVGRCPIRSGGRSLLSRRELEPLPVKDLNEGELFTARYRIDGELGRGGFGVVYRAFDLGPLQRAIALKIALAPVAGASDGTDTTRQRFLHEARLAGSLSHSNIATIYDAGESEGHLYFTQELVRGRDLKHELKQSGALPLKRVLGLARQLCDALAYAHAHGIVHRDIKPANLIVAAGDVLKVTDFGIAQPPTPLDATTEVLVAGTPGYMAPEQLLGEPVDARADIFAVGCVLYELLTGRPTFSGETAASIIEKTLHSSPPGPSLVREDLPRALDRIVARALHKSPARRYPNATALANDLLEYERFETLLESREACPEVVRAIHAGAVLILGMRLPVAAGAGPATMLETVLAEDLSKVLTNPGHSESLPRVASDIELVLGRSELLKRLADVVRKPHHSPREILRRIARLPVSILMTTGYDSFLADELARVGRHVRSIVDCRIAAIPEGSGDLLVWLYGSASHEESLVVTEDDFWDFFGSFQQISDEIKSALAIRPLIFIGFSLDDERFRHLFAEIARLRAGRSGECYIPVGEISLPSLRWAEHKGLKIVDSDPGEFLSALEEELVRQRRDRAVALPVADSPRLPSRPYKFLNYFESGDEAIFFGREAETRKLVSKIHAYPINLLYAPSGSGKTSLLLAAVLPQLARDGTLPVYCRIYEDPLGEIARCVRSVLADESVEFSSAMPLAELLERAATQTARPIVIVVDQFEELFIRYDREVRDRFAQLLRDSLTRGGGRIRFLLSMREDFLARLSEFRDRLPNIFHNEFRLGPLDDEASRRAIVGPAELLGIAFDPALVDRLLTDLRHEGIEPPQLQIVCDTLYDALGPGERTISLRQYEGLGGTRQILANYLERVLREFPGPEREPARSLLKSLVTSERTKAVAAVSELTRKVGRPEEDVLKILMELGNRRLVRRVIRDEESWFELAHEYLVDEIALWLSEKEKELTKIRELLDQSMRNFEHLGLLIPPSQLKILQSHEDDLDLTREERSLLRRSDEARQSQRRRLTLAAAVILAALLVAGVVWRYAYLAGHVFLASEDRETVEIVNGNGDGTSGDSNRRLHRLELLSLYHGAPDRFWLDRLLGFPKLAYQTDYELNQIDPRQRDRVKLGLVFDASVDPDRILLGLLRSDEKARYLVMTGRGREALAMVPRVFDDPGVDQNELDRLAVFLAYSDVCDSGLVRREVANAFRSQRVYMWYGRQGGHTIKSLALSTFLLTSRIPDGVALVAPYLDNQETRSEALAVLGDIGGGPETAALIRRCMTDDSDVIRSSAFMAALALGDSTCLPNVRRRLLAGDAMERADVSRLFAAFGKSSDVPLLLDAYARGLRDKNSIGVIPAIDKLSHGAARPEIMRIIAGAPKQRFGIPEYELTDLRGSDFNPYLRARMTNIEPTGRPAIAATLAANGDSSGIEALLRGATDQSLEAYMRSECLGGLKLFQGRHLRAVLLALLPAVRTDADLRADFCTALRWYDDDEVLAFRFECLSDPYASVREAAVETVLFPSSERTIRKLEAAGAGGSAMFQMTAEAAISEWRHRATARRATRFLETEADTCTDYALLSTAASVVAQSFPGRPVGEAFRALESPRNDIRLAGTLGLLGHPNRAEVDSLVTRAKPRDAYHRLALERLRWALQLTRRSQALVDSTAGSIARHDLVKANRELMPVISDYSIGSTGLQPMLQDGLSRRLRRIIFQQDYRPRLLRYLLQLSVLRPWGTFGSATSLVANDADLRRELRTRPEFAEERTRYDYQVELGLRPPLTVTGPLRMPPAAPPPAVAQARDH